jgi:GT2 family glycosyltransferase
MNNPKFTISILTYTALDHAKKCISAVLKQGCHSVELFLTSNGSTEAYEYFRNLSARHPHITIIEYKKNEGFIKPTQRAFELCQSEFFVVLNDDTVPPVNWLELMSAEFEKHSQAAIVGIKGAPCSIGDNIGGYVGSNLEYIEFSCAMLRTSVFKQHGLFDPALIGAYCEDQDASLRVRELGYTIHQVDMDIQHQRNTTSQHVPEVRGWIDNNVGFMQKRWAHYLKVRRFDYPIVLHSGDSCGHPLLTDPVLLALKAARPLSPLYLEVESPQLLTGLKSIEQAAKTIPEMAGEFRINLDSKSTLATPNGRSLLPGKRIESNGILPNVTLLYVHPMGDAKYKRLALEFVESYIKYPPGYSHDTIIICNGAGPDDWTKSFFKALPNVRYLVRDNEGWDIGAYIDGAKSVKSEMLVCFGSDSFFTKSRWLERMVIAWGKHGPGLYGTFASYEQMPHLNTFSFWCAPDFLVRYPFKVSSKADRYSFEHGPDNLWQMVYADGYPVKLVTWDGEYDWQDWRKPANIYRRGDQSNCLCGYRLSKEYAQANFSYKQLYEGWSNQLTVANFKP